MANADVVVNSTSPIVRTDTTLPKGHREEVVVTAVDGSGNPVLLTTDGSGQLKVNAGGAASTGGATPFRTLDLQAPTGADTPVLTIQLPASAAANLMAMPGVAFTHGISIRGTTGVADADTGAPTANDIIANLFYT